MRSRMCFAVLSGLLIGCGGSGVETDQVHGTVTMDGVPLPNAYLEFTSPGTRPAYGKTDANGEYVLEYSRNQEGAIPGTYTVRINTGSEAYVSREGEPVPAVPETVPRKYNTATTLTFEVKSGVVNEANFALDSEGEIDQPPDDVDN